MNAVRLGLLIWASYTLVAINTAAIARARYLPTAVSSILFIGTNFFLIRHVAAASSTRELLGYLVGGVAGDVTGIYLSQKVGIL